MAKTCILIISALEVSEIAAFGAAATERVRPDDIANNALRVKRFGKVVEDVCGIARPREQNNWPSRATPIKYL